MTPSAPPPCLPPLPMSQTETGALATASLSTIINAATDALYQDLFDLVHGEIKIESVSAGSSASAAVAGGGDKKGKGGEGSAGGSMESHAARTVEGKLTAASLSVNNNFGDSVAPSAATTSSANPNDVVLETRKQRMANLSFAQRRHELTRRIVQHTKSIAHVYALTAASLPKSHSAVMQQKAVRTNPSQLSTTKIHDPSPRLGDMVGVSSDALQFVKSRWVSQDEAQDALYFHHDSLWKARAHCHDVLGALCVLSTPGGNDDGGGSGGRGGRWPDFPTDVALAVDRYAISKEKAYPPSELQARLASAVRRKLVLGEVGAFGTRGSLSRSSLMMDDNMQPLPWRVVLAKGGGSIRLTFGNPRTVSTATALCQQSAAENGCGGDDGNINNIIDPPNLQQYPIEARLSVLSEDSSAPWKLLSLHVRCAPKTGESDHQLRMNRKQMFDLHRIGERAMIVEEAICRKADEKLKSIEKEDADVITKDDNKLNAPTSSPFIPRPLYRLFEVAHAFALSLQIEMLSSQAEALRRGTWGVSIQSSTSRAARGGALSECIEVSPAYFYDQNDVPSDRKASDGKPIPIAVMAIHFWSCDDTYGSPRVSDICERGKEDTDNTSNKKKDDNYLPKSDRRGNKRLSLCIRAVATVGLVVSLSGGSNLADNTGVAQDKDYDMSQHTQRNINKLLSSIRNPFELSMSDALLAATVLCADRRCHAVVAALIDQKTNNLPSWLHLKVECGAISIAALISYPVPSFTTSAAEARPFTVLFRLACDSRTGRFIPVFPRPASLLRLLACNDSIVSDVQSFRMATATGSLSIAKNGGKLVANRADNASREFTGRIVRDAFDALARSTDTLGRKCGAGGEWNDVDAQSSSLREKSINLTCSDVRASLMVCSAMAAVFGVGTMAIKIAGGVDPVVDMAGGPIQDEANPGLIRVPPLSVPLHQRIIEKLVKDGDGETKRIAQLQRESLAVTAKTSDDTLELVCFDVLTVSESASSVPTRTEYVKVDPPREAEIPSLAEAMPVSKRARHMRTADDGTINFHRALEEASFASLWINSMLHQ